MMPSHPTFVCAMCAFRPFPRDLVELESRRVTHSRRPDKTCLRSFPLVTFHPRQRALEDGR